MRDQELISAKARKAILESPGGAVQADEWTRALLGWEKRVVDSASRDVSPEAAPSFRDCFAHALGGEHQASSPWREEVRDSFAKDETVRRALRLADGDSTMSAWIANQAWDAGLRDAAEAGAAAESAKADEAAQRAAAQAALPGQGLVGQEAMNALEGVQAADRLGILAGKGDAPEVRQQQIRFAFENPQILEMLKVAGRMLATGRARAARKGRGTEETVSVGLGGLEALGRLVPSELLELRAKGSRKLAALRRLVEGQALTYETTGTEPEDRGPIIVALDESGSMCGHPMEWSRAVALALYLRAAAAGRDFGVIQFQCSAKFTPVAKGTPLGQLPMLGKFGGGGTAIECVAAKMTEIVTGAIPGARPYRKADLILVTDLEDSAWEHAFHTLKRDHGVETFVAHIASRYTSSAAPEGFAAYVRVDADGELDGHGLNIEALLAV